MNKEDSLIGRLLALDVNESINVTFANACYVRNAKSKLSKSHPERRYHFSTKGYPAHEIPITRLHDAPQWNVDERGCIEVPEVLTKEQVTKIYLTLQDWVRDFEDDSNESCSRQIIAIMRGTE